METKQKKVQAKPIIYSDVKHKFRLDTEDNLWKLDLRTNEWTPAYLNKPGSDGYLALKIGKSGYRQHRIVYSIYHKIDIPPSMLVDHIDGDITNNKPINLRLISNRENQHNQIIHRNGKLVGASYNRTLGKWGAATTLNNGIQVSLGLYETELDAHNIYIKAQGLLHLSKREIQTYFTVNEVSSDFKGVSLCTKTGKWKTHASILGKILYLGAYKTELEAHQIYLKAKANLHLFKGDAKEFRQALLSLL